MNILWCGGEDTSFPNGTSVTVSTSSSNFRNTYARCAVRNNNTSGLAKSEVFPGGAVTSCWLSFELNAGSSSALNACILLGKSGSNLGVGLGNSSGKMALVTFNGSSSTTLIAESTSSFSGTQRFDLQLISLGSSGTLNLYVNNVLWLTYTGDLTIGSTLSSVDSVFLATQTFPWWSSEFIVTDADSRQLLGLATRAPNGNGTTQSWSNSAYTNINPTTINDGNSTYTNTTGQDEQVTISALPSGNFSVPVQKFESRAMATSGASSTNLEQGVNNGGTVGVGSSHALTASFATYSDYFTTDPTTSSAWNPAASLQLDLRSA